MDHSVPFCPTLSYSVQLYLSHSVSLYSTLSDTVAVTQTGTDLDRPGQTRTDLIKRTFGTLFGTLKDLWDQCRSFLDTKLDPFGTFKVLLDQLRDFALYYSNYFTLSHSSEIRP